jgi:hypothetical protein
LIVGIDPNQKKHAAGLMTRDLTSEAKFKFGNTREGLDMMLDRAKAEMVKSGCGGVMFAIDTGGHY